jgi:hypothetical protein
MSSFKDGERMGTQQPPLTWRRPVRRILRNWRERHQVPFNFWIHLIGIPLTVVGVVLLFMFWEQWYWGVCAFVIGYLLQYIGHRVEGNDMGEWAGIKRLFGLPTVPVAPHLCNGRDLSRSGAPQSDPAATL